MPPSEAQKRATKKWNNANMQTLSVKVRRDYADAIRAKAAAAGTSVSVIIRKALDEFMGESEP